MVASTSLFWLLTRSSSNLTSRKLLDRPAFSLIRSVCELAFREPPRLPGQLGAPQLHLDGAHRAMHLDLDRLAQLRRPQARLLEGDLRPYIGAPRGVDVRAQGHVQGEPEPVVVVEPAVSLGQRAPFVCPNLAERSEAQIPFARVLGQCKCRLRLLDVEQGAEIVGTVA